PEPARHEMTLSSIARGEGCNASEPLVKCSEPTSHVMAAHSINKFSPIFKVNALLLLLFSWLYVFL
ncbi:hypothetical protein KKF34_17350, partial [Myxococcota bacterium]|nr:hypothetical protein [Myxococcota bacterium]MBU1498648.1 hypothetical protein [Myxococcota bacterium]